LKKKVREDANKEDLGSYHRSQRRFCAKKGEDIPIVKSRKRRGARVCEGSVEEGVYKAIEVTTNITSLLCAEERWKEEDGVELLVFE